MRKFRIYYAVIILICLITLFFYHSLYLLYLAGLFILIIPLSQIILHKEAKCFHLTPQIQNSCQENAQTYLYVLLKRDHPIILSSFIELRMEIYNVLNNHKEEKIVHLFINQKEDTYSFLIDTQYCGEIRISFKEINVYDGLGITKASLSLPHDLFLIVYPKKLSIKLFIDKNYYGVFSGEQYNIQSKGNDVSEIFDLKTYIPGDDIRHVHWKLSSKLRDPVVKEMSKPTFYDVLVLYDCGFYKENQLVSLDVLSCSTKLALSISEELIVHKLPHYISRLAYQQLQFYSIEQQSDYQNMVNEWMTLSLDNHCYEAIKYLISQQVAITKLIYITLEDYPIIIEQMLPHIDITIILIKENDTTIKVSQKGHIHIISIPQSLVLTCVNSITI